MENYLGILRVLGAISFVLGAVAFLISFHYQLDGFKLKKHNIVWGASTLTIIAISAALNAGAAIVTGPIRFGWISFRPGAAITPILGILFGIPGAIGAGLGNVISDILKGFITPASVSGFLGNFFAFAYIPAITRRSSIFWRATRTRAWSIIPPTRIAAPRSAARTANPFLRAAVLT